MMDHTWEDDFRLHVDGATFVLSPAPGPADELTLFKTPDLVKQYLSIIEAEAPQRIVELGVQRGGSTALLSVLARPERLLAIDIAPEAPPALRQFMEERDLGDQVVTAFGVDQAERDRLIDLLDATFAGASIDLVFDDASHLLSPTQTAFEAIFPRLRPGGLYVIEDWNWEHVAAARLARSVPTSSAEFPSRLARLRQLITAVAHDGDPRHETAAEWAREVTLDHQGDPDLSTDLNPHEGPPTYDDLLATSFEILARGDLDDRAWWTSEPPTGPSLDRPLTDLALVLVLLRAASDEIVSEIHIQGGLVMIRRGSAPLDLHTFRLEDVHRDYFAWVPTSIGG